MSGDFSIDRFSELFENLRQSYRAGRLAHAYLIVGAPQGNAMALAEALLALVFCAGESRPCGQCAECRRVREHTHPDILWLEPESKSRRIRIERIREELIPRLGQTSYGGSWKAAVLVQADRMTEEAANAFLKMLEEPPGSNLVLLLTDTPQFLLPTVVSRCQRLLLSPEREGRAERWQPALLEVLRRDLVDDPLDVLAQVARVKALLEDIRKTAAEEEKAIARGEGLEDKEVMEARVRAKVLESRTWILRQVLEWRRDVLLAVLGAAGEELFHFPGEAETLRRQAGQLDYPRALRRVQSVETLARQLERNLPEELTFEQIWARD